MLKQVQHDIFHYFTHYDTASLQVGKGCLYALISQAIFHDGYVTPACGRQARTMKMILFLSSYAMLYALCAMLFSEQLHDQTGDS
jgi:hypothetical protein